MAQSSTVSSPWTGSSTTRAASITTHDHHATQGLKLQLTELTSNTCSLPGERSLTFHDAAPPGSLLDSRGKAHYPRGEKADEPVQQSFGSTAPPSTTVCGRNCEEGTAPRKGTCPSSDPQTQLAWLGYQEELRRTWDFPSSFSLAYCNTGLFQGSWMILNVMSTVGGPVLLIWGSMAASILMLFVNSVVAEMASAYPVAGAMFTWTFKLARANARFRNGARFLSWVTGFTLLVNHLLVPLQLGRDFSSNLYQIVIERGHAWKYEQHELTALSLAFCACCGAMACVPLFHRPRTWVVLGVVTLSLHISVCLALLLTSNKWLNASAVFTKLAYQSPLKPKAWILLYTWVGGAFTISSETAAHLAEETRDPASTVPRVMLFSCLANIVIGFLSNVCFVMTLPAQILPHRSSSPIVTLVFLHCPRPVATFVSIAFLLVSVPQTISQYLSSARFFWALARDKAIPFAKFLRKLDKNRQPTRTGVLLIMVTAVWFGFLFEKRGQFMAVATVGLTELVLFSYLVPIGLYLFSEKGVIDLDGRNTWKLRGFGKPLALISVLTTLFLMVIFFVPNTLVLRPKRYSWSPVFLVGTLLVSTLTWFIYGRSHYVGPVKSLTVWTVGHEIELPKRLGLADYVRKPAATYQTTTRNTELVNERSGARMTAGPINTFDVSHAYMTYGSTGSMWSQAEQEEQTSA